MTTQPDTLLQLIERGVTRFSRPGWQPDEYAQYNCEQGIFTFSIDGQAVWPTHKECETPGYWLEWTPPFRYKLTITVQGQTLDDLGQQLHAVAASIADHPGLAAIGGNDTGKYTYTLEDMHE